MKESAYELLAAIARYWFLALALFILFRMVLSVTREVRIEKRVQREIGDAGTNIGATLVLLSDEDRHFKRGKLYAVEGETTFGRSSKCDVRLHARSLSRVHCILRLTKQGMQVLPVGRAFVVVDGDVVDKRAFAYEGSTIQMGGLVFCLRLEAPDEK